MWKGPRNKGQFLWTVVLSHSRPRASAFSLRSGRAPHTMPHIGSGLIVRMRLSSTILGADQKHRGLWKVDWYLGAKFSGANVLKTSYNLFQQQQQQQQQLQNVGII